MRQSHNETPDHPECPSPLLVSRRRQAFVATVLGGLMGLQPETALRKWYPDWEATQRAAEDAAGEAWATLRTCSK